VKDILFGAIALFGLGLAGYGVHMGERSHTRMVGTEPGGPRQVEQSSKQKRARGAPEERVRGDVYPCTPRGRG
jgi:hypothetical protein